MIVETIFALHNINKGKTLFELSIDVLPLET